MLAVRSISRCAGLEGGEKVSSGGRSVEQVNGSDCRLELGEGKTSRLYNGRLSQQTNSPRTHNDLIERQRDVLRMRQIVCPGKTLSTLRREILPLA